MSRNNFVRQPRLNWLAALGLGALFVVGYFAWRRTRSPHPPATSHVTIPLAGGATNGMNVPVSREIASVLDGISGTAPDLKSVQAQLGAQPPAARARTIQGLLDSGRDATTGQDFAIGPDGSLTGSPSLRIFLLDQLAQSDPQAAAAYAERVLGSFSTPDEWAVSLRNYARVHDSPEGRAFLRQKLEAMLRHAPWRSEPTVGFLEAFDVAVFLGGTELLPVLGELVRAKEERGTARAAYLALDRLVVREPAGVLAELQRQPELMEGREQTRANYFARADVSDPAQRTVLENYLLEARRPAVEWETFAGLYPNANFMISHNLLTRVATPDGATLAARDAAALRVVQDWLADPRFAGRRAELEKIQRRLEGFVRQKQGPQ